MTAKESATWLAVINQEEALARELHPDRVPPLSSSNGSGNFSMYDSSEYDVDGVYDESNFDIQEQKPNPIGLLNIGMAQVQPQSHAMKDEVINAFESSRKRKLNEENLMMDHKIYTCEFLNCPYNDLRHGFLDRIPRDNHQLTCPYNHSSEFGVSDFTINEVKPIVFLQSLSQPQPVLPPMNHNPSYGLSEVGVPEDSHRMITDHMSFYDNGMKGNRNSSSGTAIKEQRNTRCHKDGVLNNKGAVLESYVFEDSIIANNSSVLHSANRFHQGKVLNTAFNLPNPAENFQFMFISQFNMASVDYTEAFAGVPRDNLPKQDFSMWY